MDLPLFSDPSRFLEVSNSLSGGNDAGGGLEFQASRDWIGGVYDPGGSWRRKQGSYGVPEWRGRDISLSEGCSGVGA
ncbi:hypothetical protein SKAU_G00408750 [Synaphobranchus kaupii]|uniref:Uncharacterized protein n=1 Tax=Synaphobranchus kaupii TaxID=118154 RepID=A0A9Q1ID46_SYNKA|nr:hypothetical protein SKAU_G00408750 [Synaphobranchus kaupii]